ncbi:hypothetical protein A2W24_05680 [Microgenomates group bacterium RBG_16_45_19]|nr:MAG: hypothetical protein A2W24_05680 [Microgenomates group bacterium RBG_16_45_19]
MATISITAIIPTLNNTQGLYKLAKELKVMAMPVVVIDNQPTAAKEKFLKQNRLIYLPQTQNLGFAAAINLGAQQVKTEWLLILNDDVSGITRSSANQLISDSLKHDWIAAAPVLVNLSGQIENIGYRVLPRGKVELNFDPKNQSEAGLDGLTAACLLINTKVFRQMGGFDEHFFAYLEDVDFCLRLKQAGYHFGVVTEIRMTHQRLTTSRRMNKRFKARLDLINWWRLTLKHPKRFIKPTTLPQFIIERGRNFSGFIKTDS